MPSIDPALVGGDVVDAVRHRLARSGMMKSCTRTGSGWPLGRNSRPPFLKSPTSSFFLVSTEMAGWPAAWKAARPRLDVLELGVAIGVAGPLAGLGVGLQAEAQALQQPADQLVADREAALGQRPGEMALAPAHPQQRRLRIAADRRLRPARSAPPAGRAADSIAGLAAAAARRTRPPRRSLAAAQVGQAAADRAAGNAGGLRYRLHPATARRPRLARREQPSTALVNKRRDRRKARPDGDHVNHLVKMPASLLPQHVQS